MLFHRCILYNLRHHSLMQEVLGDGESGETRIPVFSLCGQLPYPKRGTAGDGFNAEPTHAGQGYCHLPFQVLHCCQRSDEDN
ncbi:hypothetical protein GDO86_019197 [Hymenochirus boettgeri]|uniref:Uncharacterized protein n=1 Tax=Hymenochirus boettgeri TaxID=247094 RepID=A0A8T2IFF1_9PIPI|nr:hypothetical protein GDO86_019197 [Hymenochirus boettgeri]